MSEVLEPVDITLLDEAVNAFLITHLPDYYDLEISHHDLRGKLPPINSFQITVNPIQDDNPDTTRMVELIIETPQLLIDEYGRGCNICFVQAELNKVRVESLMYIEGQVFDAPYFDRFRASKQPDILSAVYKMLGEINSTN